MGMNPSRLFAHCISATVLCLLSLFGAVLEYSGLLRLAGPLPWMVPLLGTLGVAGSTFIQLRELKGGPPRGVFAATCIIFLGMLTAAAIGMWSSFELVRFAVVGTPITFHPYLLVLVALASLGLAAVAVGCIFSGAVPRP